MGPAESNELLDVWGRVRQWPGPMRLSLASRILQSIEQDREGDPQRKTLADLIGLWDTGRPAPTDEELDRILAEERLRKLLTPQQLLERLARGPG